MGHGWVVNALVTAVGSKRCLGDSKIVDLIPRSNSWSNSFIYHAESVWRHACYYVSIQNNIYPPISLSALPSSLLSLFLALASPPHAPLSLNRASVFPSAPLSISLLSLFCSVSLFLSLKLMQAILHRSCGVNVDPVVNLFRIYPVFTCLFSGHFRVHG